MSIIYIRKESIFMPKISIIIPFNNGNKYLDRCLENVSQIEYDDYELDEDDLYFLRQYVLITSEATKIFRIYEEEGISGHNPTQDLGLIVKYDKGIYSFYFALRSIDLCGSSIRVMPLSADYPMEHELSFLNPINRLMVEMINDVVVLND